MSFASLGLSDLLLRSLEQLGYTEATPIQREAIPVILQGKDVQAAAQTGSGKTAAFALPILQRLAAEPQQASGPRALILTPTRELAAQVGGFVERYGQFLSRPSKVLVAFGGVGYEAQLKAARAGADIVVATPGRLIDLLERQALDLASIETLVLDEADRLLALGFAEELQAIKDRLPAERQTLLFSATFPQAVFSLANALLRDPTKVQMESAARPVAGITQRAIEVERDSRTALLRHLLQQEGWSRALVFVGSKRRADNVTAKLQKYGIKAAALHGDLSQDRRSRALEKFKQGKTQVLMATDVASRGIDIAQLPCVVNYDLPRAPADYIHRIGRTGRAGEAGLAVSFVSQEDDAHFKLIEKRNQLSIERERLPGFEPKEWDPSGVARASKAPVKGRRKSKKDKLREAEATRARPAAEPNVSSPWAQAVKRVKGEG